MERPASNQRPDIPSLLFNTLSAVAEENPQISGPTARMAYDAADFALSLNLSEVLFYAGKMDDRAHHAPDDEVAQSELVEFGSIADECNALYWTLKNEKFNSSQHILFESVGLLRRLVAERWFRLEYLRHQQRETGTFGRDLEFAMGAAIVGETTHYIWQTCVKPEEVSIF